MRGHGTYAHSNQLVSCGAGRIERVNKLASVRPVRGRYTGSVGDLVVGEIVEVAHRSWKVDVGSTRKATLAITSVTLPDDAQRVRTHEDTLAMRELFKEGDVVVCEVQAVHADGSIHLHTRSNRYGNLANGDVVEVQPQLVRRLRSHFVALPADARGRRRGDGRRRRRGRGSRRRRGAVAPTPRSGRADAAERSCRRRVRARSGAVATPGGHLGAAEPPR